ncbi:CDP-diacylglycerol--glycerol-3-phosphate 3-phosphatidyltransferase [Mycobacteroides salmoniphilum]|uniref:CDP-diacylglycerol--glycerol-3-phosphate 3-phosphatidyltransferase n=1 Tax=Mycobacteroides salmoniphilum TaxID=404941 RepID=UPI000D6A0DF1|nr:CDP-diacylglycerol--glycerol-3-phosphate 3-phosphatidyltransferase [Mycobacteroides salmoniphilum]
MPMPPETQPDSEASAAPVPLLNIANILTVLRIVLIPVFIVVLFTEGGHQSSWRIAAFGVFALAIATDRYDGVLARRYGLVTPFGQLADPIADKALIGAALVGLSVLGDLPWWVTVVILVREVGITVLRFSVLRHGVIPANRGGKLKTMVQSLAIAGYLLPLTGYWHTAAVVLMGLAVVLTVLTGIDYLVQALRPRPTSA